MSNSQKNLTNRSKTMAASSETGLQREERLNNLIKKVNRDLSDTMNYMRITNEQFSIPRIDDRNYGRSGLPIDELAGSYVALQLLGFFTSIEKYPDVTGLFAKLPEDERKTVTILLGRYKNWRSRKDILKDIEKYEQKGSCKFNTRVIECPHVSVATQRAAAIMGMLMRLVNIVKWYPNIGLKDPITKASLVTYNPPIYIVSSSGEIIPAPKTDGPLTPESFTQPPRPPAVPLVIPSTPTTNFSAEKAQEYNKKIQELISPDVSRDMLTPSRVESVLNMGIAAGALLWNAMVELKLLASTMPKGHLLTTQDLMLVEKRILAMSKQVVPLSVAKAELAKLINVRVNRFNA